MKLFRGDTEYGLPPCHRSVVVSTRHNGTCMPLAVVVRPLLWCTASGRECAPSCADALS